MAQVIYNDPAKQFNMKINVQMHFKMYMIYIYIKISTTNFLKF